jgi:hypothetical protein
VLDSVHTVKNMHLMSDDQCKYIIHKSLAKLT